MTVGLLLVSHNHIGIEMLNTARQMLAHCPLPTKVLDIRITDTAEDIRARLQDRLTGLDQGNGILILTDMFGSTPSNIACAVSEQDNICIVSGLNLPMLIRVLNYPDLSLDKLEQKAITGGKEGVARCSLTGYDS
jgi:PTS system ascorbate-specific IIA component